MVLIKTMNINVEEMLNTLKKNGIIHILMATTTNQGACSFLFKRRIIQQVHIFPINTEMHKYLSNILYPKNR